MRARILELHYRTRQKLQQFRKEADQEGEHRVARRIHAALLNGEGKTSGEISAILDSLTRVFTDVQKNPNQIIGYLKPFQ